MVDEESNNCNKNIDHKKYYLKLKAGCDQLKGDTSDTNQLDWKSQEENEHRELFTTQNLPRKNDKNSTIKFVFKSNLNLKTFSKIDKPFNSVVSKLF